MMSKSNNINNPNNMNTINKSNPDQIITKYGAKINNETMVAYFEHLINKIFKLLSMHFEDRNYGKFYTGSWKTLDTYLHSLLCELAGGNELILDDKYFIELLNNLENLKDTKSQYEIYRSQIFKCIEICEKIIGNLDYSTHQEGVEKDGQE